MPKYLCPFVYWDAQEATIPCEQPDLPIDQAVKARFPHMYLTATTRMPWIKSVVGRFRKKPVRSGPPPERKLKEGDWVQVLTEEEIAATLDKNGKFTGLRFMPEMTKFCGKKLRVNKIVTRIMLESTGEMRRIINPTVFLEGAYCDGGFHGNCDRMCFLFWREGWLRKIPAPDEEGKTGSTAPSKK